MGILVFLSLFYPFVSFCSAYDNFQGLGRLTRPCFPAYDHTECNVTLEEIYDPPTKRTSSNPPTTKLFLFTQTSQEKAEQLHQCGGGLPPQTTFDPNCPTVAVIHGFLDGLCRSAWMREMKEQFFLRSCYNVILVDWTWGNSFDIATGYINTKITGEQVAYVLKKIARQTGYDCKNFHVVGHSFGASAASFTGKSMQNNCKLGRFTALDSANIPTQNAPEKDRLNPTDALLVDTIHTNSGECFPFTVGEPNPLGHINFYVNDGTHQKSCYPYALESFLKLDIFYALVSVLYPPLCFHLQALQYFKASILANTDTLLIGVQCDSYDEWMNDKCKRNCEEDGKCLPMGLDTPSYIDTSKLSTELSNRKIFYVPTTLTCPYADHSGFTGLPLKPVNTQ